MREREREKKEEEERERKGKKDKIYLYCILFHQRSEMANAFLKVSQGNCIQDQTRLQN